jgi:hypothetical protein
MREALKQRSRGLDTAISVKITVPTFATRDNNIIDSRTHLGGNGGGVCFDQAVLLAVHSCTSAG